MSMQSAKIYIQTFGKQLLIVTAALVVAMAAILQAPVAKADPYSERINALQQDVNRYKEVARQLSEKANTLQGEVNILNQQISIVKAEVELSQTKYDSLIAQIEDTEKRIAEGKVSLGEIIADMYVDDQLSPIEMLASSENIGDFLDKQEYRSSIRDQLTGTIAEIKELRRQLVIQKDDAKKALDEVKLKKQELEVKQSAQQKLLSQTRGSEAAYKQLVSESQSEIDRLKEAQRQLNSNRNMPGVNIPVNGDGSYPWSWVPYPCWHNGCGDPWQLFYRECVSYVAWKLYTTGHRVESFNGQGHAFQWPATTSWYSLSQRTGDPRVGDAGVLGSNMGGAAWTGHVVYVEEKRADGTIRISEYNFHQNVRGTYGERWLSPAEYSIMTFITFPKR